MGVLGPERTVLTPVLSCRALPVWGIPRPTHCRRVISSAAASGELEVTLPSPLPPLRLNPGHNLSAYAVDDDCVAVQVSYTLASPMSSSLLFHALHHRHLVPPTAPAASSSSTTATAVDPIGSVAAGGPLAPSAPSGVHAANAVAFIATGGACSIGGVESDGGCGSRLWFPCVDTSVDRCTYTIDVVVSAVPAATAAALHLPPPVLSSHGHGGGGAVVGAGAGAGAGAGVGGGPGSAVAPRPIGGTPAHSPPRAFTYGHDCTVAPLQVFASGQRVPSLVPAVPSSALSERFVVDTPVTARCIAVVVAPVVAVELATGVGSGGAGSSGSSAGGGAAGGGSSSAFGGGGGSSSSGIGVVDLKSAVTGTWLGKVWKGVSLTHRWRVERTGAIAGVCTRAYKCESLGCSCLWLPLQLKTGFS